MWKKRVTKATIISLIPVMIGMMYCLFWGRTIGEIYLPMSHWSDELFYYKQVEGVLEYGMPLGFFGYNESSAQYFSFGAWNPLVLIPYILWGFFFGWTYMSPIYCNIFVMTCAIFVFVYLTDPSRTQSITLLFLYASSFFTTRYMLSGMSETIFVAGMIVYLALSISYCKEEKKMLLVTLLCIPLFLGLIRPYYLIFCLLPLYWIRKNHGWKQCVLGIAFTGMDFCLYNVIIKCLCAKYVVNAIHLGSHEGTKSILRNFMNQCIQFIKMCIFDLKGLPGATGLSGQSLFILIVLGIIVFLMGIKHKKREFAFYGFFLGSFFVILVAFLLLYNMQVGYRHLVTFVTLGIFLVSALEKRYVFLKGILCLMLIFSFFRVPMENDSVQLPFKEEAREEELFHWEQIMDSQMEIVGETANWDNVILWVMDDVVMGEEHLEHVVTPWQLLYATPKGIGINCCLREYVLEKFYSLKARYLAVVPGGDIEKLCIENGSIELGRSHNMVLYAIR